MRMPDTQIQELEIRRVEELIEGRIADRDEATRTACRQFVAAVVELNAVVGGTPYITTALSMLDDVAATIGKLAEITDRSLRWLEVNGKALGEGSSGQVDVEGLLRDVRRDLKGSSAALHSQHQILRHSVTPAMVSIGHRDGVVGREIF